MEADGTVIKTFSNHDKKNPLKATAKGNTFSWNLRYPGAKKLPGMILWGASLSGARAVPGTYKAQLTHNGNAVETKFELLSDPRSELTVAQMQAQFDFVMQINTTIDEAHTAIENIRKINKKLADFQANFKEHEAAKDLIAQSKSLQQQLGTIEKALYQTKNRSNQDPLNFPIKLTNKLGHISNLVMISDYPPTAQDEMVRKELTTQIAAHLATYEQLMNKDVKAFNAAFAQLQLDYLSTP